MATPLRILYVVGFSSWWGKYSPDILDRIDAGMVGGGETAALQTAFGLAKLGHKVGYVGGCIPGRYKDVEFYDWGGFVRAYSDEWDVAVVWTAAEIIPGLLEIPVRVFSQQLNDLGYPPSWVGHVDLIVSPSKSHNEFLRSLLPPGIDVPIVTVWNGVDPSFYQSIDPINKRPPIVGYWSSPDRGLLHVLRAWSLIQEQVPDAELHVYYEIGRWVDGFGERTGLIMPMVVATVKEIEAVRGLNVKFMGAQPRRILAKDQLQTRVLAYPCDPIVFTEGFCITIAEALAAGVNVVTRPVDALPELYHNHVHWLSEDPSREEFRHELAAAVVDGLRGTGPFTDPSRGKQEINREHGLFYSWTGAAAQMEEALYGAIARKGQ